MLPTEYEIYLAIAGSIFLLLAIVAAFIISINTSRKRKRKLERELMEAHYKAREETLLQVSRDLHDDIGASLSGINLFSQLLQQQINTGQNENAADMAEKINTYTLEIMAKVADMAWLFKPENNTVQALANKVQLYAADLAGAKKIAFSIIASPEAAMQTLTLLQQKNSYLICKEATNNAVKYSGCSAFSIDISYCGKSIFVSIKDNGKGVDIKAGSNGNGLKNLRLRAMEINGNCNFKSSPGNGFLLEYSFPLT